MSVDLEQYYASHHDLTGQMEPAFQHALAERYGGEAGECLFSHTVELPDGSLLQGAMDLRGTEEAQLGCCDLAGRRVLEFGGNSGWMTGYAAARAREVVTLDMPIGREELSAPFAGMGHPGGIAAIRTVQEGVRKGWWLVKRRTGHDAKMVYCDLQAPPSDLGEFDVAIMSMTLMQLPVPFMALRAAASCTKECIAITEPVMPAPEQDGTNASPVALFAPNLGTDRPSHWWHHSVPALTRMLMVVGFGNVSISVNVAPYSSLPLMTILGRKPVD